MMKENNIFINWENNDWKTKQKDYLYKILQETNEEVNIDIEIDNIDVDKILAEGDEVTPIEEENNQTTINDISSLENSKTQSEQNNSIEDLIDKKELPKFSSPIEFIHYMKTIYMKKQNESKEKSFHLKQYHINSKLNCAVRSECIPVKRNVNINLYQ